MTIATPPRTPFVPDAISWEHRFYTRPRFGNPGIDLTHAFRIPTSADSVGVEPATKSIAGHYEGHPLEDTVKGVISTRETDQRRALIDALAGADLLQHATPIAEHGKVGKNAGRLAFHGPADASGNRAYLAVTASTVERRFTNVLEQLQLYLTASGLERD